MNPPIIKLRLINGTFQTLTWTTWWWLKITALIKVRKCGRKQNYSSQITGGNKHVFVLAASVIASLQCPKADLYWMSLMKSWMCCSDLDESTQDCGSCCHLHSVQVPSSDVHLACDIRPVTNEIIHVWSESLGHAAHHDAEHGEGSWTQRNRSFEICFFTCLLLFQCLCLSLSLCSPMEMWRDVPKKM